MVLRIFYTVIAVIAALLSLQIFQLYNLYSDLDDVPLEFSMGPEDADLTVVEFIDYSCSYCQIIHPTIINAVKKDGRVRYIPRPLPSDNPNAVNAAIFAYGAGKEGKFIEMHDALITNYRVVDEDLVIELAHQTDLSIDKLNTTIEEEKEEIQDLIIKNGRLFKKIGTNATPTFVIGGSIVYVPEGRMPTVDDFLYMFNEARAQQ